MLLSRDEFDSRVSGLLTRNIEVLTPYEHFTGMKEKIQVKCSVCGHVWQPSLDNLIRGAGCPMCGRVRIATANRISCDEYGKRTQTFSEKKNIKVLTPFKEFEAVLTMRKPFTKRHQGSLEIARFATKLGTRVVGGFSKLYKHMVGVLNPESVITYSDLRFGSGRVYLEVGFVFESKTQPDYYYTDYFSRYARFQYRAQGGVSEREVAEQAGMVRIYGTGSNLYTWRRI